MKYIRKTFNGFYYYVLNNINNNYYTRSKLVKKRKSQHVAVLYISMIINIIVGIGVSVITTRFLGPRQYGDLRFLNTLFSFVVQFLTLGIFVSGSRLLAQRKNDNIRQYIIGNMVFSAAAMSFVLFIAIFVFSFIEDKIFNNQLSNIIRILSPFLFIFPFQLCIENILEGDNRIFGLSIFRLAPHLFYLLMAILFNIFIPLSLISALAIQFSTFIIIIIIFYICLKPKYNKLKNTAIIIWEENKSYGFYVYIGFIIGVASQQLGGLSIAYLLDNTKVGFFSLAISITAPLTMIPNAVGTTYFKKFVNVDQISLKIIVFTIILSSFSLLVFLIFIKNIILFLFSDAYIPVVPLVYWVSTGSIFHGFGDLINRFLGAHGKGREIRNNNILLGVANVLGYTVLVYYFGVKGAAITKLIAGALYLLQMCFYYSKTVAKIKSLSLKNDLC